MSTLLEKELELTSEVPLYEQMGLMIRSDIDSGVLKVGDLLPSESEFCTAYDISRSTVRQALSALEAEGRIVRLRGKGSFVAQPKVKRSLHNLYSFSEEIMSIGLEPSSRVLAYEVIEPGDEIREKLALTDPQEKVYSITRVRYAGEEPLALEMALIPQRLCPFLTQEVAERGSIYKTVAERAELQITHAKETYETALLGENEAHILGAPEDTAAFFVQRVSYTQQGEIFEYTVMIVRSDRVKYEVELTADDVQLVRSVE